MKKLLFLFFATPAYCAAHDVERNLIDRQEFFDAAKTNNIHEMTILLNAGVDPHVRSDSGNTALHFAAYHGSFESSQLLINSGCSLNDMNDDGMTPLLYAAYNKHEKLAELYISHGASVNEPNDKGVTPLMAAAESDQEGNIVALLIQNKACILAQDIQEKTALHYAIKKGSPRVVEMLVEYYLQTNSVYGLRAFIPSLFWREAETITKAFVKNLPADEQRIIQRGVMKYSMFSPRTLGIATYLGFLAVGCAGMYLVDYLCNAPPPKLNKLF